MVLNYIEESNVGLVRDHNEDYVKVFRLDTGLLCIVCDGLGGNNAGEVASETAAYAMYDYFKFYKNIPPVQRIIDSLEFANREILELSKRHRAYNGMATTGVMLYLEAGTAYYGHIGDSRLYYFYDDELLQLTKDHSLVQRMVDQGLIKMDDAEKHPYKNVITQALGDTEEIKPDVASFLLPQNGNWKFLICTDGVSNLMEAEEMAELMVRRNLDRIADSIGQTVEERGAHDNYSFIIISNE